MQVRQKCCGKKYSGLYALREAAENQTPGGTKKWQETAMIWTTAQEMKTQETTARTEARITARTMARTEARITVRTKARTAAEIPAETAARTAKITTDGITA